MKKRKGKFKFSDHSYCDPNCHKCCYFDICKDIDLGFYEEMRKFYYEHHS